MSLFRSMWFAASGGLSLCAATILGSCGTAAPTVQAVERPIRVLPTNATAVDFIFDLIDAERVIAVPDTVGDYATVDEDFSKWTGERAFHDFSAEVLLAFEPDLVVVSPWQDQNTINRLLESGIQVVELPPVNDLEDIRQSILITGKAVGEVERAKELLEDFDARTKALRQAAKKRGRVVGLVYTNYTSGGWAAGSSTTAHHLMSLAGVANGAAEAGRVGHNPVDIETLLGIDPDILVISKPSRDYGVTRAFLDDEEALKELGAIREGRIIELPAGLFSTASHHLLDAAELLAREVDAMVASGVLKLAPE